MFTDFASIIQYYSLVQWITEGMLCACWPCLYDWGHSLEQECEIRFKYTFVGIMIDISKLRESVMYWERIWWMG